MKKQIIVGITFITCVALCSAVWLRSTAVGDLPAEPSISDVSAKIEAQPSETPHILLSDITPTPKTEAVSESEPEVTTVSAEKETAMTQPSEPMPHAVSKSAPLSTEPKPGSRTVLDGKPYIWIPGFGWVKDERSESVGTFAADMNENGNKIGVIDGNTAVGNPGDELTGNKVGIMRGTVGSGGDINKKVGIMDDDESTSCNLTQPPAPEQPESTGDVIYVPLQPPVTKDCTPPPYKPNGEPINP